MYLGMEKDAVKARLHNGSTWPVPRSRHKVLSSSNIESQAHSGGYGLAQQWEDMLATMTPNC